MEIRVTFQVNTVTGEVEVFQVDEVGQATRVADHDAIHEQIAYAVAEIIDPRADVSEMLPAAGLPPSVFQVPSATPESRPQAQELDEGGT
jgi:hypothetical protein